MPSTQPHTLSTIRSEIEALQAGAEVQRRKALHTAAVVGATCCALLQPIMDDSKFTVVILDESSQMTEAMSMIPLMRSKCRYEQMDLSRTFQQLKFEQDGKPALITKCIKPKLKTAC